jgi:ABC-type multidrug transport system ATPase subunit
VTNRRRHLFDAADEGAMPVSSTTDQLAGVGTPPGVSVRGTAPGASQSSVVEPALTLQGVTRRHLGRSAWAPVDLRLDAGTVCVLTGANGSGKTTLLRLAAGLLRPSSGLRRCPGRALYVRAGAGLRSAQTVAQAVAGTAALAGRQDAAPAALARLDLEALAHRPVGTLSGGERGRAALAAALAVRPRLLCLDEPTGALDGQGVLLLLDVLDDLRAAGCATVVATHQPHALLASADAHLHLVDGRLVAP